MSYIGGELSDEIKVIGPVRPGGLDAKRALS
jgi:hypothetical protein